MGRFVVLKATVSSHKDETAPASQAPPPPHQRSRHDSNLETPSPQEVSGGGPGDGHYWTVSGGKGVQLTAPGAVRRLEPDARPGSVMERPPKSVHNRVRQFFVENLRTSRVRTHSEQQSSSAIGTGGVDSPQKLRPPIAKLAGSSGLPPHAHTITAGTGRAVAQALLQSTQRAKDDGALGHGSAYTSEVSSPIRDHGSISSLVDSDAGGAGEAKSGKKKLKGTKKIVRRLLQIPAGQKDKRSESGAHPDPSKLPREMPQSSIEFTQSRLKNLSQKVCAM